METAGGQSDSSQPSSTAGAARTDTLEPHPVARSDFDLLAALYDPNLELDVEAPLYDNLDACLAALTGGNKKKPAKSGPAGPPAVEPRLERRFLPEQMPVSRQRAPVRHVLARMGEFSQGPLGRLRQLHVDRVKIKVSLA